jgi:hypothetical protein
MNASNSHRIGHKILPSSHPPAPAIVTTIAANTMNRLANSLPSTSKTRCRANRTAT